MGFGKTLRAVLQLDNRQAKRAAKQTTKDIKRAGAEADAFGRKSKSAMSGLAEGATAAGLVIGGAAGLIGLLGTLQKEMNALATSRARLYDDEMQRLREVGELMKTDWVTNLRALTGGTRTQAFQTGTRGAARERITPEQYGTAYYPLVAKYGEAEAEKLMPSAGEFLRAYEGQGAVAGAAIPLLRDAFGMKTPDQVRGGLAEIGGGFDISPKITVGMGTEVLTRTAAALSDLSLRQQIGYVVGLSNIMGEARLIRTAMMRQAAIPSKVVGKPMLRQLMTDAGLPEDSTNRDHIRIAITKYLSRAKTPDEETRLMANLSDGLGLAQQELLDYKTMSSPLFTRDYERVMAAKLTPDMMSKKALGDATYYRELDSLNAAGLAADAQVPGPGASSEARAIMELWGKKIWADPDRANQYIRFAEKNRTGYEGGFFSDPGLTPEQAQELYKLNRMRPQLRKAIRQEARDSDRCFFLDEQNPYLQLRRPGQAANKWHFLGNQGQYVGPFADATRRTIESLRKAELETGRDYVPDQFVPPENRPDAGAKGAIGAMGQLGLTGGISAKQVIINWNGPNSRPDSKFGKTGTK